MSRCSSQAVLDRDCRPWDRPRTVLDTALAGMEQSVTDLVGSLGLTPV